MRYLNCFHKENEENLMNSYLPNRNYRVTKYKIFAVVVLAPF